MNFLLKTGRSETLGNFIEINFGTKKLSPEEIQKIKDTVMVLIDQFSDPKNEAISGSWTPGSEDLEKRNLESLTRKLS